MPYSHIPNDFPFYVVEKTIWSNYNFSKWKSRKFRQRPAGLWKFLESRQCFFCLMPKGHGCRWVLAINICERGKKLSASRRSKTDFHLCSSLNNLSASERTTSRS